MPMREAFLGDDRFQWSDNRCRAFVEAVAAKGHGVAAFSHRCRKPAPADDDLAVEAWLMGLPKPVALLACYDIRGRQAIDACRAGRLQAHRIHDGGVHKTPRHAPEPLAARAAFEAERGDQIAECLSRGDKIASCPCRNTDSAS